MQVPHGIAEGLVVHLERSVQFRERLRPVTVRALLAQITGDRPYALYLCAVVLGMRRGELLGLTWEAVDLDQGRLWVRQALAWVDGRRVIQPPKTRACVG